MSTSEELVYVSWGGTGRGTTLRAAVARAAAEGKGLVYLAVLDDGSFADLDDKFLSVVKHELEWLLEAQLEVAKSQTSADDVPVRILIHRGDVAEEVAAAVKTLGDETEVIIGAPVPLAGHDSVEALLAEIERRVDVPVALIDDGKA